MRENDKSSIGREPRRRQKSLAIGLETRPAPTGADIILRTSSRQGWTSDPTRQIIVSDGDVAANFSRPDDKSWLPLGFNNYEKRAYANKDFMLNAIEYAIDPNGLVEARSREVKLRLLDTVRAKSEKTLWQALNLGGPLLLLGLFAMVFFWLRRRRYAAMVGS